jgi:hypothetical protein
VAKKKSVSEILAETCNLRRKEERIQHLRANDSHALRSMLQGAFDPGIEWLLPEGVPPFNKSQLVDQQGMLYAESKKLYLFVKGGIYNLRPLRREALFIEILEKIDPSDADLLCAVKDKKMPYSKITYDLVFETFPGMIPAKETK